jgi:signal transduction histidine kinase
MCGPSAGKEMEVNGKILLVDDDGNLLASYRRRLRGKFDLHTARDGQEGLEALRRIGPFAVVASDLRMQGMDGIQFLSHVRGVAPDSVRMLITGYADLQTAIKAVNKGNIFRLLTKPCPSDALTSALEAGVGQYRLVVAERERSKKEKASLEEQLYQSQKMEGIGTLAGGIAHDFNNILTGIMGYAELASLDIMEGSKAKYHIQQSILAAHRAKDLVQQILAFSRQDKQERKPLDIQPIITDGLKFLRASIPATIEIRHKIPGDLGVIAADPTQIHQVLMNLCTNAAHAMRENGGVLEVSLTQFDLVSGVSGTYHGMEAGRYLKLTVSDTGDGIPPVVLPRIFEPYFTTKEVGMGTGLGLAVAHGIVKSYGGGITVSSEPGKGTVFEIFLPRIDIGNPSVEAEQREPLLLGEGERILFVDDESTIVEIAQVMLKNLGYEAEARTSSIEARELFRANPDRFDLVITDMTMPNMTGDRLAQEIFSVRAEIPVILCTGFSELMTKEKAKAIGIEEFAMKPLVMKDLAVLIRRALDRGKKKKQR